MTGTRLDKDIEVLESLSKILALAVGLLYLSGFLVVAFHLSDYGVSSLEILQLQYLIAGAWAIVPPFLVASHFAIQDRFDTKSFVELSHSRFRRFVISTAIFPLPFAIPVLLLTLIFPRSKDLTWGILGPLCLFYFGMWLLSDLLWKCFSASGDESSWWLDRKVAAPFYASTLLLLALLFLPWFSVSIYPLIPFSLGGGKPLTVAFFEGDKKMPDEIQKANPSDKRSIPYKLLLSTDKYFVVVAPSNKERALQISRDSVAGVVVLSAK